MYGTDRLDVICRVREKGAFQKEREKVKLFADLKVLGRSHTGSKNFTEKEWKKDMRFSQITRIQILSVLISQVCSLHGSFSHFSPSVLMFHCLLDGGLDMTLSEYILKLATDSHRTSC